MWTLSLQFVHWKWINFLKLKLELYINLTNSGLWTFLKLKTIHAPTLLLLVAGIITLHCFVHAEELETDSERLCTNHKENYLHPSDLDIQPDWIQKI